MMRRLQQFIAISVVAIALSACILSMDAGRQLQPAAFDTSGERSYDSQLDFGPDPGVLTGQLQNGFRYYLRSTNSAPQNDQLEVRLIVKAGSLYERPEQHGYAHLLEHMAFRGTSSFSAQDIESLLSQNGLRWGTDVNATTHYGATVYRFSLTQKDADLLPEIFTLMSEWLDSVEFDPAALENEKRIVDAELRERYTDRNHIIDPVTQSAYAGSRYSSHHPAGDIKKIRNASADGLKQFWKSYYRADNAALVVTGSKRPWQLEPLIVSHFSGLDAGPVQSIDRALQPEVVNTKPGVMFFKDGSIVEFQSYSNPTLELPQLSLNFISGLSEQATSVSASAKAIENRFRNQLLFNVYSYLLRDRIDNVQECSTVALEASLLESMQTVEHVKLSVTEKNLLPCLGVTFNAVNVVSNTKLTVEEFAEFRQLFEEIKQVNISQYRSRNAAVIADSLVDMVVNGEHVLSSWDIQKILKKVVDGLDRKMLNRWIANVSDSHRLVYSIVTNKPVPPAMSELIASVNSMPAVGSSIRPISSVAYGDLRADQSSVFVPALDSVVESNSNTDRTGNTGKLSPYVVKEALGETYYEWQLDNGATVLLLPDDRFDHVAVTAISKGGYAHRSEKSAMAARSLPEFLSVNGIDGYTNHSLRKTMESRQLLVKPFVSLLHHGINASGRTADLPTLLTMVNSYFKEPLVLEPQSTVFLQQLNQKKSGIQWQNLFWSESTPPPPAKTPLLDKQSFVVAHRELFGSTEEFDFVFVGSVDPDELQRQLVRISANQDSRMYRARETQNVKAVLENSVSVNHGTNNTEVSLLLSCSGIVSNDYVQTQGNTRQHWRLLSDVIAERLRYSLREQLGIVYEIESDIPVSDQLIHRVGFSIAPADETRVTEAAYEVLAAVSSVGISESELAGALARDIRRVQRAGGDYQTIASDRAQQLLFSRSTKPASSSLPDLDNVNRLARCINSSTRQVTLDSVETFKTETLVDELTRPESAFRQLTPIRLR